VPPALPPAILAGMSPEAAVRVQQTREEALRRAGTSVSARGCRRLRALPALPCISRSSLTESCVARTTGGTLPPSPPPTSHTPALAHAPASPQSQARTPQRMSRDAPVGRHAYIRVHLHPKRFPAAHAASWAQRVVAATQQYVVVSKPAGVPAAPTVDNLLECAPACTAQVGSAGRGCGRLPQHALLCPEPVPLHRPHTGGERVAQRAAGGAAQSRPPCRPS
jgi:hypothetical protein